MDIQKTSIHPLSIANLQRPGNKPVPPPQVDALKPVESNATSNGKAYSPTEIKSAIQQLDRQQAHANNQLPKPFTLHNRAQQALNAYNTQQNQTQQESKDHIQQVLGVDYYA